MSDSVTISEISEGDVYVLRATKPGARLASSFWDVQEALDEVKKLLERGFRVEIVKVVSLL